MLAFLIRCASRPWICRLDVRRKMGSNRFMQSYLVVFIGYLTIPDPQKL